MTSKRVNLPNAVHLISLLVLGILIFSFSASAKFARSWRPVPIQRLIRNVGDYVGAHPKDANGHYILGRIHSLGFARGEADVEVTTPGSKLDKQSSLPSFTPYDSILVEPNKSRVKFSSGARNHLVESLKEYRTASRLSNEALYIMGLGWMLEQGAPHARDVVPPPLDEIKTSQPEEWRRAALAAYRRAYNQTHDKDSKSGERDLNNPDSSISVEAGEGIIRLLGRKALSSAEKKEVDGIREHLKAMAKKPGWITPIILSMRPDSRLADLIAPKLTVRFDLAANGGRDRWPWVRPDTGILVWDPEHSGRITSGAQLFGARTWQMFWRNGYEPLAALDDNRDGFLTGAELDGIAVWFDRNGNGKSDPGEVIPVSALGITRISVQPESTVEGMPTNPHGARLKDGSILATFDWTPESIPDAAPPSVSTWD